MSGNKIRVLDFIGRHRILTLFCLASLAYCVHAAAIRLWISSQFDGQVLDTNGQPIHGAVVLAVWGLGNGNIPLKWLETVTRADGSFTIPRWGPSFSRSGYPMSYTQPILYVAREGYVPAQLYTGGFDPSDTYRFVDATPIGSKHFIVTLETLEQNRPKRQQLALGDVSGPLSIYGSRYSGCLWSEVPLFAAEMTKVEKSYGHIEYTFKTDARC